MKIALIWPKGYDTNYVIPISLGYLKSNIGKEHDIKILDCSLNNIKSDSDELKNFLIDFEPHVVGISSWSTTYEEAINVLKVTKKINKNFINVIGGAHVTCYQDIRLLKEKIVDFMFAGESEISFAKFLEQINGKINGKKPDFSKISGLIYFSSQGKLIKNDIEREENLDKIKIPDYDIINLREYLERGYRFNTIHKMNAPVWITRGCPYGCKFCTAHIQNGRKIRAHSINYVINWIRHLYHDKKIRQINIIDDNFTFDIEYAKEFCREIIKLKLRDLHIGTPNGVRMERLDDELLKLMKKAGWENIIVAPESGSLKTLKNMGKNIDLEIVPEKIKKIKKAGLKVHGFFIIGYPGESAEDIEKTIHLVRKCKLNFFFLNNFQPLLGTEVYNELVKNNEIQEGLLPKNYSDGERVYTPKELKNFNFPKMVLKEYFYLMLSNPLNIPYAFKLINKRMILKKIKINLKNMLNFR